MSNASVDAAVGHQVVGRDEWLRARVALLDEEKAHQRASDALAVKRRELPWVRVDEEYVFDTEQGRRTLVDLFDGCSQLITYHFMYGSDWTEGCPSCSFWADSIDGTLAHLAHRDTRYVHVSNAPLGELLRYRRRMGWSIPWVSAAGTTFQADFGVAGASTYNYADVDQPNEESPGLSAFVLRDGHVFHTYSTYARGLEPFNSTYALLDMTAQGRDEDDLPWTMAWLRRHDAYEH
jgi:predicted dithiol-disulfide oxidoreductase (DUF899 family)